MLHSHPQYLLYIRRCSLLHRQYKSTPLSPTLPLVHQALISTTSVRCSSTAPPWCHAWSGAYCSRMYSLSGVGRCW
jgi:hypothetical protein